MGGRRSSSSSDVELGLKCGILARLVVLDGQFIERADQRFGHVASAKLRRSGRRHRELVWLRRS